MNQNLGDLRKDYKLTSLLEGTILPNPIDQFRKWFDEAVSAEIPEPNAFTLSTVDENGFPQGRIVLLKGIENNEFQFFTNYQSAKGKELELNPVCAATFFWPGLERQIRILGQVARLPESISVTYFQSRPRESQVGAWTSPQSTVIQSREILESRQREIEKRFEGVTLLPKPHQWGGFAIQPTRFEFWQGRPGRLHDRLVYRPATEGWELVRLAP